MLSVRYLCERPKIGDCGSPPRVEPSFTMWPTPFEPSTPVIWKKQPFYITLLSLCKVSFCCCRISKYDPAAGLSYVPREKFLPDDKPGRQVFATRSSIHAISAGHELSYSKWQFTRDTVRAYTRHPHMSSCGTLIAYHGKYRELILPTPVLRGCFTLSPFAGNESGKIIITTTTKIGHHG